MFRAGEPRVGRMRLGFLAAMILAGRGVLVQPARPL